MRSTGIVALLGSLAVLLAAIFVMPGRDVAQFAAVVAAFAVFVVGVHGWVLPRHYARSRQAQSASFVVLRFDWQDWFRLCVVAAAFFGLVILGASLGAA